MNKQEAIEKLTNIANGTGRVTYKSACNIVEQIHEPQKVVIPKFVAEWIEDCKRSGWHLEKALRRLDDDEEVGDWAYDENDDLISEKVNMVARAWLDGYEVEKEKLYTVEIPDPYSKYDYRFLTKKARRVFIDASCDDRWKSFSSNQLTESEIKQDFSWAWDAGFAKEVEEPK